MRAKLTPASGLLWVSTALVLLACAEIRMQAADMKFQAFLLWGTDDNKPPEGKAYKPVDPEISKKLKDLPLKWAHWFEVNQVAFAVSPGATKEVPISEKCQLNVKQLAGPEVEVSLVGKGKEVVKRKQSLPKGEMLVLGGNAPNSTAWLVLLKRIE
jgi:hypothetical protein